MAIVSHGDKVQVYVVPTGQVTAQKGIQFVSPGGADTSPTDVCRRAIYVGNVPFAGYGPATDEEFGEVKLNSAAGITLDSEGRLSVGGMLGSYPDGGAYYPADIAPSEVGSSALLMTDGAKGLSLGVRSFAILAGCAITCRSAAAGATQYRIVNNYANRFICRALQGGRLALNQTDATENGTARIVSIRFANGNDISVSFDGQDSNNDIIITVNRTVNPDSSVTSLRGYGTSTSNDVLLIGQGVGASGGKAISLGQSTYVGAHQAVAVGNSVHVTGTNSAGFGHTMLINKQFCFGAGRGHDFTNAQNGVTAVGTWSRISSTTRFVVGDGSDNTSRSNVFEVVRSADTSTGLILRDASGGYWNIHIDSSGKLLVDAI